MNSRRAIAAIEPHAVVMAIVFAPGLVAGYVFLPGENERVAMLERDGKNRQAMAILEARFAAGDRRPRTLFQLVGLYEQFGRLTELKRVLEALAVARPRDVQVQRRLAQFYSATQDNAAYIGALEREIEIKYSEASCRELVGLHRLAGNFDKEQAAIQRCRQRGYRRVEDIVRLAELVAADGDALQAAQLLRSVDDLRRLKSDRERLQLFTMLVEADQPREAQRRAVRWVKSARDDEFTLTLIESLVRDGRHDVAIELARDVSVQGDAVSLTVAEIMLDRGETVAARAYLRGWSRSAGSISEDTAYRFVEAALDAEDPELAYAFAGSFGLERTPQAALAALAEALRVIGRRQDFEDVKAVLRPETLAGNPLIGAADEFDKGRSQVSSALLDQVQPDKLDAWRLTLWARLMRDTGRGAQAQSTLRTLGVTAVAGGQVVAYGAGQAVAPQVAANAAARPAAEPVTRVLRRKKRTKRLQLRPADKGVAPAPAPVAAKAPQKAPPSLPAFLLPLTKF